VTAKGPSAAFARAAKRCTASLAHRSSSDALGCDSGRPRGDTSRVEQVEENVRALDRPHFSDEELAAIDRLTRGRP
jgi:hypothetical protein